MGKINVKETEANFTYRMINSQDIVSDDSYQRPVDYRRVKKIVSGFNPQLVNPIKVSKRDGKYYVFDGQHTLRALVLRNDEKDLPVECKVYENLTKEQEAKLFSEQNGFSKGVDINAKLKALYVAGDVNIIELKSGIEKAGFIFDFSNSKGNRKIVCCRTVYDIYRKSSIETLQKVLQIIMEAWGGESDSIRKEIISGVYLFHVKYEGEYDERTLVDKLRKTAAVKIVRDGSASISGGNKRFARQILNIYNKGGRTRKLDDRF